MLECWYAANEGILPLFVEPMDHSIKNSDNSKSYKLDLTTRDNHGRNGFQIAKLCGAGKVVNLMKEKFPSIAEETPEQLCVIL